MKCALLILPLRPFLFVGRAIWDAIAETLAPPPLEVPKDILDDNCDKL